MTDAAEYRQNAQVCADLANATPSTIDREIWLRMERGWLELADKADQTDPEQARE